VKYKVNILSSAENDLFEIYQYVFQNDSEEKADKLFSKLKEKCISLENQPRREHVPKELAFFGVGDFLEITQKPYRIIYRIIGKETFIFAVLDGRRDMQKILYERLLRG